MGHGRLAPPGELNCHAEDRHGDFNIVQAVTWPVGDRAGGLSATRRFLALQAILTVSPKETGPAVAKRPILK